MSRAARFLGLFNAIEREGSPLALLADEPEGYLEAVLDETDAFAEAVLAANERVVGSTADVIAGSFASAACAADGTIVVAEPSFREWLDLEGSVDGFVRLPADGEPQLGLVMQNGSGRPVAVTSGGRQTALGWPLGDDVRFALETGAARYAVVAFRPDRNGWERAIRALRLTRAQGALVEALVIEGNLKSAAKRAGIAYETARKVIAQATERVGARRQTELVRIVLRLAAGDVHEPELVTRIFADLFSLSIRQAQIARIVAGGASRGDAARMLGVSEHAVKTDLKHVHAACGVANAVDLSRLSAEIDALAGLATACDVTIATGPHDIVPLRMISRTWAPGRIAVSDFGPASGHPVMILHSLTMGRAVSPRFVAALQARGMRPLSIDRSGFGLTDFVEDDCLDTFVRDFEDVLDAFGVGRAMVVARAMMHGVVTAATVAHDRLSGAILINPGPSARLDRVRGGLVGATRAVFYDRPWLTEPMARLLSRRTSSESIEKMTLRSVEGSPADRAALADPVELATVVRSGRQCAMGLRGFLNEISAQTAGRQAAPLVRSERFIVVHGRQDQIFDVDASAAYWETIVPAARFEWIEAGGRFIHISHAELLADWAAELAGLTPNGGSETA